MRKYFTGRDVWRAWAALVTIQVFDSKAVERGGQSRRSCRSRSCLWVGETSLFTFFVGPAEERGDELKNLEFLRVGAIKREKVQEVIGDDLAASSVRIKREQKQVTEPVR